MEALGRFCAERLTSLVRTLELTQIDEYHALQKLAQFATLVATYEKGKRMYPRKPRVQAELLLLVGFLLILEPYETEAATVPNPIFHFT
jgi:DNA excision repair protein ERCC-2